MITAEQSRELALLIRDLTPVQKADFYYFTIVENQDPYEFLSSINVTKHGTHDQQSHGNWASGSSPNDYGMSHRPAQGKDGGASLDNVTNGIYPDDVYSPKGVQIYGTGFKDLDKKAHAMIMEYRGKPDKTITIYRAVPKNPNASKINAGDWVTPIKEYAVQHGESNLNNDYQILHRNVKAKEIFTSGDSWLEWGYIPELVQKHGTHDQSTHGNWASGSSYDGSYPTDVVVSSDITKAVWSYTMNSAHINNTLRQGQFFTKNETEYIKNMDLALKVAPRLSEDKILLRGFHGDFANEILDTQVGTVFQDKGYLSTTEFASVANDFGSGAVMWLKVPKGTRALEPRKFFVATKMSEEIKQRTYREGEYILPRNTQFKIKEIDKGSKTILAEVVS